NAMAADGKAIVKRLDVLKDEAAQFRNRWDIMAPYFALSRYGITSKVSPGQKLNPYVWDSTSQMAAELMAQFVWSHIASPAQKWGFMRMRDESKRDNDPINEWLEESGDRMLAEFARSKFYSEGVEACIDWTGFGTGDLTCEEAPMPAHKFVPGFR